MKPSTAIVVRDPNVPDPPKRQRKRLPPGAGLLMGAALGHVLDDVVEQPAKQHGLPPGLGSLALGVLGRILSGGQNMDPADAAEMRDVADGALSVGVSKIVATMQEEPLVIEARKAVKEHDGTQAPRTSRRRGSRPRRQP